MACVMVGPKLVVKHRFHICAGCVKMTKLALVWMHGDHK